MGQKTFIDWNGRKRKEQVRPTKRANKLFRTKPRTNPGFKTKVDRFRALLIDAARDWEWRRDSFRTYLEEKGKPKGRLVTWTPDNWRGEWFRRGLEKIRKMREVLRKEGIYDKVLESIGTFKFREKYKNPFSRRN